MLSGHVPVLAGGEWDTASLLVHSSEGSQRLQVQLPGSTTGESSTNILPHFLTPIPSNIHLLLPVGRILANYIHFMSRVPNSDIVNHSKFLPQIKLFCCAHALTFGWHGNMRRQTLIFAQGPRGQLEAESKRD